MERVSVKQNTKIVLLGITVVGFLFFGWALLIDPHRAWANYLLGNVYFLSLAIGASFFFCLQYITQSGWSAAFRRIPEAIMGWFPVASILFGILFFGIHDIYHWSHADAVANDPILQHKAPYLNTPFFIIRIVLFFAGWLYLSKRLRKLSLQEDETPNFALFERMEFLSKVMIFFIAFSFSFFIFDAMMSIDSHWFSTLYAAKNFISGFLHANAIIALIAIVLKKKGAFSMMNENHLHDFTRYIFMACIVWGYFWFAQFMLIWYANIPEETAYYVARWGTEWRWILFLNVAINWLVPFIVLMPRVTSRNPIVMLVVIGLLMIGQYIDLFVQIMPGTVKEFHFGLMEIGIFIPFVSLFTLVVMVSLSKAKLVPENHPYIEECVEHHF